MFGATSSKHSSRYLCEMTCTHTEGEIRVWWHVHTQRERFIVAHRVVYLLKKIVYHTFLRHSRWVYWFFKTKNQNFWTQPRNFLPFRCSDCTYKTRQSRTSLCPICRGPIEDVMMINMWRKELDHKVHETAFHEVHVVNHLYKCRLLVNFWLQVRGCFKMRRLYLTKGRIMRKTYPMYAFLSLQLQYACWYRRNRDLVTQEKMCTWWTWSHMVDKHLNGMLAKIIVYNIPVYSRHDWMWTYQLQA